MSNKKESDDSILRGHATTIARKKYVKSGVRWSQNAGRMCVKTLPWNGPSGLPSQDVVKGLTYDAGLENYNLPLMCQNVADTVQRQICTR